MEETNTWALIEKYLPDYYSNKDITRLVDLQKLIDGEYEEGDHAHQLLQEEYGSYEDNPSIRWDYNELYIEVLEKTIRHMNQIIEKDATNG